MTREVILNRLLLAEWHLQVSQTNLNDINDESTKLQLAALNDDLQRCAKRIKQLEAKYLGVANGPQR